MAKSVNILIAMRWVAKAWELVKPETIVKCFRKAGVLDSSMDVVTREEEDPFIESDECIALQRLMEKTVPESCTMEEYLSSEDDLPVCLELDDDNWEDNFMTELGQSEQSEQDEQDVTDDDDEMDDEPSLKIKSFKEAILSLEDVHHFLESRGHMKEAAAISSAVDTVAGLHLLCTTQSDIHDYFDTLY